MFKRLPYLLAAVFILANISYAGILNEDVAYWYWADDEKTIVETIFNPSSAELKQIKSKLLIKVQQTVYDPETAAQIINQADGYLYAYSVTNLGWMPDANGLIIFGVEWGDAVPTLVTVSNQTPSGWLPTTFSASQGDPFNGPAWQWMGAPNVPGLTIGQTVGGFWAVSPYPESPEPLFAMTIARDLEPNFPYLRGKTTGPAVPEPGSIVALMAGTFGLVIRRLRKS